MPSYKFSLDLNGLGSPAKRHAILRDFKRQKADILLQETHFKIGRIPSFRSKHFTTAYHSPSPDNRSRGVCILIRHTLPWSLLGQQHDTEDHRICIKGRIGLQTVTIMNVYLPNKGQRHLLSNTLETLEAFAEGEEILGGDFKFTLDSSRGLSTLSLSER